MTPTTSVTESLRVYASKGPIGSWNVSAMLKWSELAQRTAEAFEVVSCTTYPPVLSFSKNRMKSHPGIDR